MAEAPTPEDLAAKRQELADIRKANSVAAAERDVEAANARRLAEYEALEREIEFEKQSQAILAGVPPTNSDESVNTPPNNSSVSSTPTSYPSAPYTDEDEEKDGE